MRLRESSRHRICWRLFSLWESEWLMTAFVCTRQNIEGLKISYWTTAALVPPPLSQSLWHPGCFSAVESRHWIVLPSMEERLGSMVTAPTATSSSWWMGLLLLPQLSDPIHRKWPTWLALLVALRTPLQGHLLQIYKHGSACVCVGVRVCNLATLKQKARPVLRSWSGFTVALPCSLSR